MRTGMSTLIDHLRTLCDAGTADWSDDTLQRYLDRHRTDHREVTLHAIPVYEDGTYTYTDYRLPHRDLEQAGTASGWRIYDSAGSTIGTADYSVNYEAGIVTFSADTENAARYADYRVYDVQRAAAEVWEAKAALVASNIDWSSDNHALKSSQEYEHCLAMARRFRALAGPTVTRLVRGDENSE